MGQILTGCKLLIFENKCCFLHFRFRINLQRCKVSDVFQRNTNFWQYKVTFFRCDEFFLTSSFCSLQKSVFYLAVKQCKSDIRTGQSHRLCLPPCGGKKITKNNEKHQTLYKSAIQMSNQSSFDKRSVMTILHVIRKEEKQLFKI